MKAFTFSPDSYSTAFREADFIHIKGALSEEFYQFAQDQLAQCRLSGRNELPAREIKSKKKQYLFDLPQDDGFLSDLTRAISRVTGSGTNMTLSERHIMIYDEKAAAVPQLHKDRFASEFSVGIPLEQSMGTRIALLPWSARSLNLLDTAVYCQRTEVFPPLSANAWALEEGEYPERVRIEKPALIELDAQPGDIVIFSGSSMYHGRLNAARSAILYFKLNTMRLDPLGEDPSTAAQRVQALRIMQDKSDEELLQSTVALAPRFQHVSRHYSRIGLREILRVNVSGEKDFTISDDDCKFLFALQSSAKVRHLLIGLGIPEDRLLSHMPRVRRLGILGGIDFLT